MARQEATPLPSHAPGPKQPLISPKYCGMWIKMFLSLGKCQLSEKSIFAKESLWVQAKLKQYCLTAYSVYHSLLKLSIYGLTFKDVLL